MDKIKYAAIILVTLGEQIASELFKHMSPKETKAILAAINDMDAISEADINDALNIFIQEAHNKDVGIISRENLKSSILLDITNNWDNLLKDDNKWIEKISSVPVAEIASIIAEEHPQVITAIIVCCFYTINSDYGTKLLTHLPNHLQINVIKRITNFEAMSNVGIEALTTFFKTELEELVNNTSITLDGIDTLATVISTLDAASEHNVVNLMASKNKPLADKIQDRIFPFHKLAELDKKSLQILLAEVNNEDLILALKGSDENVRTAFFNNMPSKTVDMIKEDLESKGPVKVANSKDAQKRIIKKAKMLEEQEKIILASKNNSNIVY